MPRSRPENVIPVAPVKRLMLKAGAKRISHYAAKRLALALEEKAITLTRQAIKYAFHARRRTVKEEDIALALSALD